MTTTPSIKSRTLTLAQQVNSTKEFQQAELARVEATTQEIIDNAQNELDNLLNDTKLRFLSLMTNIHEANKTRWNLIGELPHKMVYSTNPNSFKVVQINEAGDVYFSSESEPTAMFILPAGYIDDPDAWGNELLSRIDRAVELVGNMYAFLGNDSLHTEPIYYAAPVGRLDGAKDIFYLYEFDSTGTYRVKVSIVEFATGALYHGEHNPSEEDYRTGKMDLVAWL